MFQSATQWLDAALPAGGELVETLKRANVKRETNGPGPGLRISGKLKMNCFMADSVLPNSVNRIGRDDGRRLSRTAGGRSAFVRAEFRAEKEPPANGITGPRSSIYEQQVALSQMNQDILAAAVDCSHTPAPDTRFESGLDLAV
jgi:hypothetical protein